MRKWLLYVLCALTLIILASFGFRTSTVVNVPKSLVINEPTLVLFPQLETELRTPFVNPPFIGTSFNGFKEALAFKESQGNYFIINTLGYLGKYQFGIGTLQLMGVYNATQFLNDPMLQERVFHINISRNKWILRREIEKFDGRRIRGVVITESGILAAAHLAGAGNVKKYLYSNGHFDTQDAYGTSLSAYIKRFSGYDISGVSPSRNPKI